MKVITTTVQQTLSHRRADSSPDSPEPQGPCDCCEISFGKKALNATAWGIAGAATVGVLGTLLVANSISGPDALGAFLLAPAFAGAGGIAGAIAGWKIMS